MRRLRSSSSCTTRSTSALTLRLRQLAFTASKCSRMKAASSIVEFLVILLHRLHRRYTRLPLKDYQSEIILESACARQGRFPAQLPDDGFAISFRRSGKNAIPASVLPNAIGHCQHSPRVNETHGKRHKNSSPRTDRRIFHLVFGENMRRFVSIYHSDGAVSTGTAAQHGLRQTERNQSGIAGFVGICNGLIGIL